MALKLIKENVALRDNVEEINLQLIERSLDVDNVVRLCTHFINDEAEEMEELPKEVRFEVACVNLGIPYKLLEHPLVFIKKKQHEQKEFFFYDVFYDDANGELPPAILESPDFFSIDRWVV